MSESAADGAALAKAHPWVRAIIEERISAPTTIRVDILEDGGLDPTTLLGQAYRVLWLDQAGDQMGAPAARAWVGSIVEVAFMGRVVDPMTQADRAWFQLCCVPGIVARMMGTIRTRAFLPIPEGDGLTPRPLLGALLREGGQDMTGVMDGVTYASYPAEPYALQAEESDYAFLCRTAEHAGISHFWTADIASGTAEPAGAKLVFADAPSVFPRMDEEVQIDIGAGGARLAAGVLSLHHAMRTTPSGVKVSAWEPSPTGGARSGSVAEGSYGPPGSSPTVGPGAEWLLPGQRLAGLQPEWTTGSVAGEQAWANHLARMRFDETAVQTDLLTGTSNLPGFAAGRVVTFAKLREAVPSAQDGQRLLTGVTHELLLPGGLALPGLTESLPEAGYRNRFAAVPHPLAGDAASFRPPRVTPVPRMAGAMRARIAPVEEANPAPAEGGTQENHHEAPLPELDDQGRYIVAFLFPMHGVGSDQITAEPPRGLRMPRLQSFAAGPMGETADAVGVHAPLRPGANVMIAFQDGDPGRLPFIIGAVPDMTQPSPVTGANALETVARSVSGVTLRLTDNG